MSANNFETEDHTVILQFLGIRQKVFMHMYNIIRLQSQINDVAKRSAYNSRRIKRYAASGDELGRSEEERSRFERSTRVKRTPAEGANEGEELPVVRTVE